MIKAGRRFSHLQDKSVQKKEQLIGLWSAQNVPSSFKHVSREPQAEDAWNKLQGWKVAAEEAVKTENGEKQKWRIKV